jgi:putative tryptophan/tyrosine transport system substrate-binding protein
MRTQCIGFMLCVMLLAFGLPAYAQKIPRVGILRAGAGPAAGEPDVLIEALRGLGYVEGKNILIDVRYAQGNRDRLREFAMELVQTKVDVIYTGSSPAIFALKQATQSIPIVMVSSTDPVRSTIITSLAKPGGNITGMSLIADDLWPKRLE